MEAKLSVIVPVYNVEKYLRQCIESILNQSMREIELILVDDGSTDSSGAICDEYAGKDARIKVIHQKNRGLMAARKVGVARSTCSYVTFVDGDDFIDTTSYCLAEESMQSDIDIIIFGMTVYFNETNQKIVHCPYPEGFYCKQEIREIIWPSLLWNITEDRRSFVLALWNKIYNRTLLQSIYQKLDGYDFFNGEDSAVVAPLMTVARTVEIKDASYYYYRQRKRTEVPSYLTDTEYFDKLYQRYRFFREEFAQNAQLTKQVEYDYMFLVNLRRKLYGDTVQRIKYIFPFDKVKKGEQIVLYGAGTAGQTYMAQLRRLDYCQVVLWVDQNDMDYEKDGVLPVERIITTSYDKIVISIQNEDIKYIVESNLIAMGVEKAKIVK